MKIAMIQLNNYYTNQRLGYQKTTSLIELANSKGAVLAVLPELSGCGYIPNQSIWSYREPIDGETVKWACHLSQKYQMYIGAGFLYYDGIDYYNAYFISNPKGEVDGMVFKEDSESYCFKRSQGALYIDTKIGRIGIGICFDNHHVNRLYRMKNENIDLMLMPHASPLPTCTSKSISKEQLINFQNQAAEIAEAYTKYLGVPTVYVNAIGEYPKFQGGFAVKAFNTNFSLQGGSLILNASGAIMERMEHFEGCKVIAVSLEKQPHPNYKPMVYHGDWLHPGNWIYRKIMLPYVIHRGRRCYERRKGAKI